MGGAEEYFPGANEAVADAEAEAEAEAQAEAEARLQIKREVSNQLSFATREPREKAALSLGSHYHAVGRRFLHLFLSPYSALFSPPLGPSSAPMRDVVVVVFPIPVRRRCSCYGRCFPSPMQLVSTERFYRIRRSKSN